jgi:hypothetical protein
MGHPCLIPRPLLKKSVASPLIRTEKVEETTQLMIQLVIFCPKPIWRRINHNISQLIQS